MSDTTNIDPVLIEAQNDFEAYRTAFETKYDYGLALSIDITQDGRLKPQLQIIKLIHPVAPTTPTAELSAEDMRMAEVPDPVTETAETPTDTTQNADTTPEETSGSDSNESISEETA